MVDCSLFYVGSTIAYAILNPRLHSYLRLSPHYIQGLSTGDRVTTSINDPIETKTKEDVRKQEYALLPEFYWDSLDISNQETVKF